MSSPEPPYLRPEKNFCKQFFFEMWNRTYNMFEMFQVIQENTDFFGKTKNELLSNVLELKTQNQEPSFLLALIHCLLTF